MYDNDDVGSSCLAFLKKYAVFIIIIISISFFNCNIIYMVISMMMTMMMMIMKMMVMTMMMTMMVMMMMI